MSEPAAGGGAGRADTGGREAGGGREPRRLAAVLFYGVVIALIVGSFLAQILRGECPVP